MSIMKFLIGKMMSPPRIYALFQNAVIPKKSQEIFKKLINLDGEEFVIDFGCGLGQRAQKFSRTNYLGIDLSENRIRKAKKKYGSPNISFEVGNQRTLDDIKEASVDLLFGFGVLHHMSDKELAELSSISKKILKQGGLLRFIEPLVDKDTSAIARLIIKADVGQFGRDTTGYVSHFVGDDFSVNIRTLEGMLRIPYRHCFIECKKL